jgi:Tol biopolymer transport system component
MKGAKGTTVVAVESKSSRWLQGICWLPKGRMVYSQSESPGQIDESFLHDGNLWQISVDSHTGALTSKPKRTTQWAGSNIFELSASADGNRMVLLKTTFRSQVYLGQLAAGGKRMSFPRRLTDDEASDSPSAWTADSKAVIFLSDRVSKWGIFRQEINQGTAELVTSGSQYALLPRLSADGAWLLYVQGPDSSGPATPFNLMRVSVDGGVPQAVLETRNWQDWHCALFPANLCILVEGSLDYKRILLTAFDPLKGRGKLLRVIEEDPRVSPGEGMSPDGSTFAIAKGGAGVRIRLLSLVGGADREITVKNWQNVTSLDWSADGKGFYCGSSSSQGATLLYVDLQGNAQVLWQSREVAGGGFAGGIPSPDGRYLAIRGMVRNVNAWMLEDF